MPEINKNSNNLKTKTADGLFWSGIGSVLQQIINLIVGILLARKLSQDDYGMANLLAVFIGLSYLIQEGGFKAALINRKNINNNDYNSAFFTSLIIGILLYTIFFFLIPFIANYLNEPKLIALGRFQFLGVLVASTNTVPCAMLIKQLKNKTLTKCSFMATIISGCLGISLAYNNFAYWGIAAQSVCYVATNAICMWIFTKWKPNRKISFKPIAEMLPFSCKLLISNIFTSIGENLLTFIIGKNYNKTQVGIYAQGVKWSTLGQLTISSTIEGVAQPVMVQAQDKSLVFNKLMRFCVFISFPCMLGFAFLAPELIPLTIGSKWISSISVLQILCLWAALYPTYNLYNKQLLSSNCSGALMWITIAKCIAQIVVLYFTIKHTLNYIALGYVSVNILFLVVIHLVTSKYIKLSLIQIIKNIAPYLLIIAFSIFVANFIVSYLSNIYIIIIAKILITATIYIGLLYLCNSVILKESIIYIKNKIIKRKF